MGNSISTFQQFSKSCSISNGLLLGGRPSNPRDHLYQGVVLLFHRGLSSVLGLQINRPLVGVKLSSIVESLGYDFSLMDQNSCSQVVYFGGLLNSNRLHFVHSLDWTSASTQVLSGSIGVTSDISILSALTIGQGPSIYRACAGMWRWDLDSLRDQIGVEGIDSDCVHKWEIVPVEQELVFKDTNMEQWRRVLVASAEYQARFYMV